MHVLGEQTHVHSLSLCARYGRRFILLLSIALQTVFGVAVAFAPNFPVYVILRFLVGTTISGVIINAFVLGTNRTQNTHSNCSNTGAWIIQKLRKNMNCIYQYVVLGNQWQ